MYQAWIVFILVFLILALSVTVLLLVTRDGAYHYHGIEAGDDDTLFKALWNRLHYVLCVFTTTGGGITARSPVARGVTTVLLAFVFVIMIALVLA